MLTTILLIVATVAVVIITGMAWHFWISEGGIFGFLMGWQVLDGGLQLLGTILAALFSNNE